MSLKDYEGELMKSDTSLFPSYTLLTVPYRVICRERYNRSARKIQKQFKKEHARIEMLQINALHGVRIHKEFCECVLVPPSKDDLITLTEKQKERLEYMLCNEIQ